MTAHTSKDGSPRGAGAETGRRTTDRRTVFLSYCRHDETLAASIGRDLTDMGVDVWRDERLSGGQAWWDTILESIRGADAVLFVLSGKSLDSVPCGRELDYARSLGKPMLPVRIDSTAPGVAPPFLASLEWIDYSDDNRAAVIRLMRAVNALPPAPELPDTLPEPPAVPLSYTTNLAALVHQAEDLSLNEQHSLIFDLREGLDDESHRDECAQLLRQLRSRRELLASVARQIDEALAEHGSAGGGVRRQAPDRDPAPEKAPPLPPPEGPPVTPSRPVTPEGWTSSPVQPRRRSRRLGPILIALVVGLLLVPAIIVIGALLQSTDADTYGDDATLDALWDSCAAGNLAACDTLYDDSPGGSGYQQFGSTCGGTSEATAGSCSSIPTPDPPDPEPTPDPPAPEPPAPEPAPDPPDDAVLDELWDGCASGDLAACDSLYLQAEPGSDYETFGGTCGLRGVSLLGACASSLPFPYTYGDAPDLDALQDSCVAGDLVACDSLYRGSPSGSDYEAVGSFCGWQSTEPMYGACAGG